MKKILVLTLSLALLFSISLAVSAQSPEYRAGIDAGRFGYFQWAIYDGGLQGWRGVNIIGYSQENYFNDFQIEDFNPFWGFGTTNLYHPYIGVGIDYVIDVIEPENLLFISGGVSVSIDDNFDPDLKPRFGFGMSF